MAQVVENVLGIEKSHIIKKYRKHQKRTNQYGKKSSQENTYLNWSKENMNLNGFSDKKKYIFTRTDCISFLQEK